MTKKYKLGVFIFTRDLRIVDNKGLEEAHKLCDSVMPIFIFNDKQVSETNKFKSNKSVQFMIESLDDLNENIVSQKGQLYTFYGNYEKILQYIIKSLDVKCVFCNFDYTPFAKNRSEKLQSVCETNKIDLIQSHDVSLYIPGSIKTSGGEYYQKFTPFYDRVLKLNVDTPLIAKKINWYKVNKSLNNILDINDAYIRLTTPDINNIVEGGRNNALKILHNIGDFTKYDDERNILIKPTTQLSAYLKFGCVSPREVYYNIKTHFNINHALIRQLIWRDFYLHLVDGFPRVLEGKSLKLKYDNIVWSNNKEHFKLWCEGKTGYPIVDACMKQLNTTGYMHNRGRLITASFLVKILQIDWRWGELYFATKLVDYDPASNNGNWQWVAGSGADSQPYFRIMNPWTQSEKFDKDGLYIKKWLPELESVKSSDLHKWDKMLNSYDVNYPLPIVDYGLMRTKTLELYKKYV